MTQITHQATAVAIGARALLIEGPSGSGKSSLALALIDRGARLIGDDGVLLDVQNGMLIVHPHPNTRGLIEVRNLGLLELPVCDAAPAGLVLRLDDTAPRFVESAEIIALAGLPLPMLRLWPHEDILPLKAELALDKFGLERG